MTWTDDIAFCKRVRDAIEKALSLMNRRRHMTDIVVKA